MNLDETSISFNKEFLLNQVCSPILKVNGKFEL